MPKIVDPNEKRAELVEASWSVIASEGLHAATMRRVAAAAGCTTGALTHYFPDRRALLVDALRAAHYQAGTRMLAAAERTVSPSTRLRAVLLEALPLDEARLREWRVWLAFWAESMHDPELGDENARRYAEWRTLLHDLVAPLTRSRTHAKREVARLIAVVDGLGLRLTRHALDDTALRAAQRECRAVVDSHLADLLEEQ